MKNEILEKELNFVLYATLSRWAGKAELKLIYEFIENGYGEIPQVLKTSKGHLIAELDANYTDWRKSVSSNWWLLKVPSP